ncbi:MULTISPECIES: energy transducer TonB [Dickeya]|uniref:Ferric siderophore transport system, periplasmic binding protein TonB n=1 Tax=Dickeya aquatica TaxID=1401087 RepID=A0A375A933_9GAMM|nr:MULTISPECIES: energy transducer TonB [Dickeya]SLM62517.1 Ferric siderophore transport system, periplasmic binding protein TonB [Dickeya aquatica]
MTHSLLAAEARPHWPTPPAANVPRRQRALHRLDTQPERWPAPLRARRIDTGLMLAVALALHGALIGALLLRQPPDPITPPRPLPVVIEFAASAPAEAESQPVTPPAAAPAPPVDTAVAETPEPADVTPVTPPVVDTLAQTPPPVRQAKPPKPRKTAPDNRQPAAHSPATTTAAPLAAASAPVSAAPPSAPLTPPSASAGYLRNPAPAYPDVAINRGWEGTVLLHVQVRPDGKVQAIELQRSSGYPALDDAARQAVQHWSFVPARRGDRPETGWVVVPIDFTLNS